MALRFKKLKKTPGMKRNLRYKSVDKGFYGHMTHESIQANEDSVHVSGDGFKDSSVPKKPITDYFYP
jgi:hypothetical protein